MTAGVVARAQDLAVRRSHPAAEPSPVRAVTTVTAAASANRATVVPAPADSAAHAPRRETVARDTLRPLEQAPVVPAPAESAKAD